MTQSMTYDELAERLGTTRNAARVLAQRRKWARYTSQEDGKARVRVPEDELVRLGARRSGHDAEHEPPHDVLPTNGEIEALKANVQALKEQLAERSANHAAELERLQDQVEKARAEADHAKSDQVRMARDVATMFNELKTMADRHVELHTERGRLQAELERAHADLEQARRPWWRRLMRQ